MFNKILKNYISSNLHVTLALWAFCRTIALQQGISIAYSLQLAIVGFGWAAYQYIQIFVPFFIKKITPKPLSFLRFFAAIFLGVFGLMSQPFSVWVVFAFLTFITVLYALPLKSKKGLRFIPALKIFAVALCWTTLATVSLVALQNELFLLIGLKALLWMVVLILPFEIRDMHKDASSLKTIPQLLGKQQTKLFGFLLVTVLAVLATKTVMYTPLLWAELVTLVILALALFGMHSKRNIYYTSLWIEAIPVLWLVLSITAVILF